VPPSDLTKPDLFLDPSSTRTGYALMRGAEEVGDAGYLRPERASDPAMIRCLDMGLEVEGLIQEFEPDWAIVEIPSGKVHRRLAGRSGGAGLSVYGMAVGVILGVCNWHLGRRQLHGVTENEWTGGVPKGKRCQLLAAQFPAYAERFARDPGGDVADALGLGEWWYRQLAIRDWRLGIEQAGQ